MTDPRIPGMDEIIDIAAAEERAAAADASADEQSEGGAGADATDPLADALRDANEQKDKYLRLYAEFENFRKRAVRDRMDAEKFGMSAVMRGLLETLDDLGRVAHMTPAGADLASVLGGVEMVEKKLLKSLAGHGMEVVNPEGEVFNPALHEAITTMPAALPEEDDRVAQVYQVGYVLNGTLLRPARVVVKQWNG